MERMTFWPGRAMPRAPINTIVAVAAAPFLSPSQGNRASTHRLFSIETVYVHSKRLEIIAFKVSHRNANEWGKGN